MKDTIKSKPRFRIRQGLWFIALWVAGVLTVAAGAYGLRALLEPVLGL